MKTISDALEKLVIDIEGTNSQLIEKKIDQQEFELWDDPDLRANLSGNIGAFFVRSFLKQLNVDEHHIFRWRLENKYRQYQLLNYYFPNSMAETIGVSQLLATNNGEQKIRELCESGFFVKATLGDRSGIRNNFDRSNELDEIIRLHQNRTDDLEEWVLQKRLTLTEEFRIHTFSRDLIYGLTYLARGTDRSITIKAEDFVLEILEKLPDTILQGTLIGWDIGITDSNEYYVIEANFTGFHPEFSRGFQTSGYFGDIDYGPIVCAWLNSYFRDQYHISIGSVEKSLLSSDTFYQKFMFYVSLFKDEKLDFLRDKANDNNVSTIVYLGEDINELLIDLIRYFQVENFKMTYYLITSEKNIPAIMTMYPGNVNIATTETLVAIDQHRYVNCLSHEKRKVIYCQQLLSAIQAHTYLII
ncbi:hypothetical protein [Pedobacter sp. L105]|uniref:hypothetical protein n=1 Tax=Pedobacter sp. L105 TaxID=1641871 RepID=UPI00131B6857|nr:hypothetical protein [Pedobacter sp. L105]